MYFKVFTYHIGMLINAYDNNNDKRYYFMYINKANLNYMKYSNEYIKKLKKLNISVYIYY